MSVQIDSLWKFQKSGSTLINGLLFYAQLDESSGNAYDEIGPLTGTASNITYTESGKIGRCFTFNGSSSVVNFGDNIEPTTAISIFAWIKATSLSTETAIVYKTDYSTGWCGYRLTVGSSGYLGFLLGDNTGGLLDITYGTGLANSAWRFVGATWDGSTAYMWIDTGKRSGASWTSTIVHLSTNLCLGSSSSAMWWPGEIDEVGIWNRALTDSEVTELYNSGAGKTYPF